MDLSLGDKPVYARKRARNTVSPLVTGDRPAPDAHERRVRLPIITH